MYCWIRPWFTVGGEQEAETDMKRARTRGLKIAFSLAHRKGRRVRNTRCLNIQTLSDVLFVTIERRTILENGRRCFELNFRDEV